MIIAEEALPEQAGKLVDLVELIGLWSSFLPTYFLSSMMESVLWRSPDLQPHFHNVESPVVPNEPAWTTARCNRLLRPLSSKIALLRKSSNGIGTQRRNSGDEEERESPQPEPCHISSGAKSTCRKHDKKWVLPTASSLGIHGLNWDPSPRPRKKVKLTYSSREIVQRVKSDAATVHMVQSENGIGPSPWISPGFINVDRPLVPSIVAQNSRDIDTHGHEKRFLQRSLPSVKARSRELFRRYAKSDYPDYWKLYEGIHSGLETLLKATSKHLTGNRNGARSLLSTCLRKIPEYIALQEHWCKLEDPDSAADVSSSIYGDLETVGARTLQGSNALQEAVRAHGVDLIGSAVIDGLICFRLASRLVKLCLHLGAYDEGQRLVECMLRNKSFPQPTSRDDVLFSKELSILDQFAIITGRFGFLYRKLTTLFENNLLPIEWISSPDMIERWSGVIQCISEGNSDARDAGILLRTVISMSEGQPFTSMADHIHRLRIHPTKIPSDSSEGCSQMDKLDRPDSIQSHVKCTRNHMEGETAKTGLRLLAALCALDFAQNLATGLNSANTPVLQHLALEAHQIIETQEFCTQSMERSGFYADGPCLVLLAAGLSPSLAKTDQMALQWCLNIFECTQLSDQFYSKAASFLSVVACWRGQALASDGFEFMQEIVQQLLGMFSSDCCLPETRTLVGRMATTAAIQYASMTSKPRHLSWALDAEKRVNDMTVGLMCQTPRRIPEGGLAKARLGFRWEEGICEWVSGTPGVPKPKPIIYRDVNNIASDTEAACKPKPTGPLNPSRRIVRCFRKGLFPSTRSNHGLGREEVGLRNAKKTCGDFLTIEVNGCSQANIEAPPHDRQHTVEPNYQSSLNMGADELSNPESMRDRPLRYFEKQAQAGFELKTMAHRNAKEGKENRDVSQDNSGTVDGGHNAHRGLFKHVMETGDSEDELSFR